MYCFHRSFYYKMKVYHNETYVSQDGFSIEVDKIELFIMVREYMVRKFFIASHVL